MAGELDGLLVVTVEQALAAPYLSGKLAQAGARVIKVERPEGDFARDYDRLVHGESAYFVWVNGGKESIALDLADPDDAAVLRAMLAKADIFIQNLMPGAIARLGFDPETLREAQPRLITVSISGYGSEGPYRDHKAYDMLVQAEAGLASITGTPDGPARVGVSVCDIACGMTGYHAVLEALIGRGISGRGRHIEVSLFQALADWLNVPYLQYAYGGSQPARAGLTHVSIAPYGAYAGRDGQAILLAIQNEREWARFAKDILGEATLADDPRFSDNSARVANRPALDALINAAFARMDSAAIVAALHGAAIACARVNGMAELESHPQSRFVDVATPSGPVTMLAAGALANGAPAAPGPVPALDEHGKALRREFGQN